MANSDLTGWLSTAQAARQAGVSREMIVKLMRSGALDIRWTALGRLIEPSSLQRYIDVRSQRRARLAAKALPERSEAPVGA